MHVLATQKKQGSQCAMATKFLDMLGVGMDDGDAMLYDLDGIDPESQMAMIEAMHGDGPGERMVDGDFFKEFPDDFDDDDLQ